MDQNAVGKHRRRGSAFKDLLGVFPDDNNKRLLYTAAPMCRFDEGRSSNAPTMTNWSHGG